MVTLRQLLLILILTTINSSFVEAYDKETRKIMPFVATNQPCYKCHAPKEADLFKGRTTESCHNFCATCHKDLKAHHKVNSRMDSKLPEGLKFNSYKVACYTCHNLKIRRFDKESWKSESLYENWFSGTKIHKTYYLSIRNNEGKLCQKCH
ncbi:hypothetical protein KKA14_12940 [bacterium]|nr:hypothetical protein [bacterium]